MRNLTNKEGIPNIMIIDDMPENLDILSVMLEEKGYKVRPVTNGKSALHSIKIYQPDLILLDINMTEMNGYEVCRQLKNDENLKEIPVIFISALNETADKLKAFSIGGVDYITKPFQHDEVMARIDTHIKMHFMQIELEKHNTELESLVQEQIKEIYDSQMVTIFALAKLSESRDDDTGKHLERVQILCRTLSIKLSKKQKYKKAITKEFIEQIYNASPLHDIGKVAIPDSILLKPGKLTPEEFEIMKKHASIGAETLEFSFKRYPGNKFLKVGIDIARHHHERWDGSGYPDKLSGENIPLCARIMTVVDVYDAMRSKRCYKEPRTHEDTLNEIVKFGGKQFDPVIAETFNDMNKEIYDVWEELND